MTENTVREIIYKKKILLASKKNTSYKTSELSLGLSPCVPCMLRTNIYTDGHAIAVLGSRCNININDACIGKNSTIQGTPK